jgi:hypothetical protein
MNLLPSLPTDNLYKFCAISGVVIVMFVGYTTWQKWSELRERAESIQAEADAVNLSVPWWQTFEKERSEALKSLAKNDPTTPTIILNGDPIPRDQFWKYLERREKDIETGRQKIVDIMASAKKTMSLEQEMKSDAMGRGRGHFIRSVFDRLRLLELANYPTKARQSARDGVKEVRLSSLPVS